MTDMSLFFWLESNWLEVHNFTKKVYHLYLSFLEDFEKIHDCDIFSSFVSTKNDNEAEKTN